MAGMNKKRACLVLLSLLLACGDKSDSDSAEAGDAPPLSKSEHIERYPDAYCTFQDRCDPDYMLDQYAGDVSQCISFYSDWLEERLSTCDFDGAAAGVCVQALADVSCEDCDAGVLEDSCGEIIDC